MTKPICTNFHFCAPKIFQWYLVSNNSTVSKKKMILLRKPSNRCREGQKMTLTFHAHVG